MWALQCAAVICWPGPDHDGPYKCACANASDSCIAARPSLLGLHLLVGVQVLLLLLAGGIPADDIQRRVNLLICATARRSDDWPVMG